MQYFPSDLETKLDGEAVVEEDTNRQNQVASVENYIVTFTRSGSPIHALRGVSLSIGHSEVVALVGESGSGKSVLGLSMLGLLDRSGSSKVSGRVLIAGNDISKLSAGDLRRLRREQLGAIFQDPMTSLNPTMRIGNQLGEVTGSKAESIELLASVGVPEPAKRLSAFPFELSGGLRQRVMIAMALAGRPKLIIADEPTTALDVTVQAQILALIGESRRKFGTSFVLITHDLGVAAMVADRVVVMYGGEIVEAGTTADVLTNPQHPYTKALLNSRLTLDRELGSEIATLKGEAVDSRTTIPGCAFEPRCPMAFAFCATIKPKLGALSLGHEVACLLYDDTFQGQTSGKSDQGELSSFGLSVDDDPVSESQFNGNTDSVAGLKSVVEPRRLDTMVTVNDLVVSFKVGSGGSRAVLRALRGASLQVTTGEAVAVVGESGSGKSTLLRTLAGLNHKSGGSIELAQDAKVQMVFQDSGASLTPWMTIRELLDERLVATGVRSRSERDSRIMQASDSVGLNRQTLSAKSFQLSGGQRQRAALARAVVVPPEILLCDEPTSALDVSLAAVVLNLISKLRKELNMTLLFVTHDLAVARVVADRIAVMYLGRFVEVGTADQVLREPTHPYTRALMSAVPGSNLPPILLNGDPASPLSVPSGCSFHPRCPEAIESCCETEQSLTISRRSQGHLVACNVALAGDKIGNR